MYIRQKKQKNSDVEVIIKTDIQNLTEHPSIVEKPELFEIVNGEIPTANFQWLIYDPRPVDDTRQQIQDLMAQLQELQNRLD